MRASARTMIAIVATAGVLAGCAVGPNYHRPAVQTPNSFRDLANDPQLQVQTASYADLPWWQVFQDQKLQELIRTALKQNYDLQLATERINAARAQLLFDHAARCAAVALAFGEVLCEALVVD